MEGGLLNVIKSIYKLFDILNKEWHDATLLKQLTLEYSDIDKWIFTGFHYRLSWIFLLLFSLINKKYLGGIFGVLYGASLLSIGTWGFHGQPFVLTSLTNSVMVIIFTLRMFSEQSFLKKVILYSIGLPLLFLIGWLSIRLLMSLDNPKIYKPYMRFYEKEVQTSQKIKKWTCNNKDVKLVYYPGGYIQHFFTGLLPLTKYTAMYPWIAEVGQEEVIKALKKNDVFAIVFIIPTRIWGRQVTNYLEPLINFLENEYIKIEDWVFVSPALYSICPTP